MEEQNWHSAISNRVEIIEAGLDSRATSQLRTKLIKRVAARLDQYSDKGCSECASLKTTLEHLLDLMDARARGEIIDRKEYHSQVMTLLKHLKGTHKLIEEGTYISLGTSLGLLLGVVMQNMFTIAHLGIGLCFGVAVGSMMDAQVKKENRVI